MKRKKVFLMCGIPGTGKSTWIHNRLQGQNALVCSRDSIRFSMLKEGEDYFSHEDEVFSTWINAIQTGIKMSFDEIYIDATHINPKSRNKVLNLLDLTNCDVIAVNFTPTLDVALEQNDKREGLAKVPHSVISRMFYQFVPATLEENSLFTEIIEVKE